MSLQYSPMSEDSDDNRYCEIPINISSSQTDSLPTSPVSPHRYQRPFSALSSSGTTACPSHGCTLAAVACAQPRQRGSDSEGQFPSSPSDIYQTQLRHPPYCQCSPDGYQIQPQCLSLNAWRGVVDGHHHRIFHGCGLGHC